jgi:hypothetical protein
MKAGNQKGVAMRQLKSWPLLGAVLGLITVTLLSVATIAATNQDRNTLGERVKALEQRVAALETMRWTEQDVRSIVSLRIWDRLTSCRIPKRIGPCSTLDLVVSGLQGIPDEISHRLYQEGRWTAWRGRDDDSWGVSATISVDGRRYGPLIWYAWESNSLVWSKIYYDAHAK